MLTGATAGRCARSRCRRPTSAFGHRDRDTSRLVPTGRASAGELVLALVSISGPHTAAQSATVTGAGLTWSRAAYADVANTRNGGTAEVWQAFASSVLSAATVTATGSLSGYDASITIATFSGAPAPSVGVEAGGASSTGAPTMSVTTSAANSVVWGVGYDRTSATSHTPITGQSMVTQWLDTNDGSTQWAQSTTGPVATKGTIVSFGDSAPTTDAWNVAVVEVRPGTVTLAADQSATTDAVTHSTVVSPSFTTATGLELAEGGVDVAGVPQSDHVDHQAEGGQLVLLAFPVALADLAFLAEERLAGQGVPPLADVEVNLATNRRQASPPPERKRAAR